MPPSTEQVNVAPASPVKATAPDVWLVVGSGAAVMAGADGAIVSTVHETVVAGPGVPAELTPRTASVCDPSARPV